MKNIMNLAPQPMMHTDLAAQLQTIQKARPARTVNTDKEFSIQEPSKDKQAIDETQPTKKDKEQDFDNVLSGQVTEQQKPNHDTNKPKAVDGTEEVQKAKVARKDKGKKFQLLSNVKTNNERLLKAGSHQKDIANLSDNLKQASAEVENSQDLLSLALKNKMGMQKQQKAPLINELALDKNAKGHAHLKGKNQGKFALDASLFENVENGQEVNLKVNPSQEQNNLNDGNQLTKQLNQQNQKVQADNTKQSADNFAETQDQAMAKNAEPTIKPSEQRSETSKFDSHNFGFKGQNNPMPANMKSVAKTGSIASAGVNKNFAQATEMMDPKVKVQIDNHQANLRITTEKAGEVAVRLQMQQEGVTDIKLVGENAEVFNKKEELQAALQSEGLDLGQFDLAQDFEQKDHDNEAEEHFENEENGTVIASTKGKTSGRVRNGATMHVQA